MITVITVRVRGTMRVIQRNPLTKTNASLRRIEAREEAEREAKLYPPIGKQEMQERIKEVKTRLGAKYYD